MRKKLTFLIVIIGAVNTTIWCASESNSTQHEITTFKNITFFMDTWVVRSRLNFKRMPFEYQRAYDKLVDRVLCRDCAFSYMTSDELEKHEGIMEKLVELSVAARECIAQKDHEASKLEEELDFDHYTKEAVDHLARVGDNPEQWRNFCAGRLTAARALGKSFRVEAACRVYKLRSQQLRLQNAAFLRKRYACKTEASHRRHMLLI